MIIDPSLTLEAVLAGAVATSQPEFHVDYVLYNKEGVKTKPAPFRGALNSTTDVTLLAAPQQGFIAEVLGVSIYNKDTASVTVIVKTTDGTDRIINRTTLATLETLHYDDQRGWYSTDANGAEKTVASAYVPSLPSFLAYNSATDTNQTGNGATVTVDFDTEVFDVLGNFSGDTFTAPDTGKYQLQTTVTFSAIPAGSTTIVVRIVTSNRTYTYGDVMAAGTFTQHSVSLSVVADLDSGDTASVTCTISGGAGDTASILGGATLVTYFSGIRVG